MKKNIISILTVILALMFFITCIPFINRFPFQTIVNAEETIEKEAYVSYDNYADITVTANNKEYSIFYMIKNFVVAPIHEDNVYFIEIENILPYLGYTVTINSIKKTLHAESPANTFEFKANSLDFSFNKKAMKFTKATKYISRKILVPSDEVFRLLGFTIIQDKTAKTLRLTKIKPFDIGNFIFYNNNTASSQDVYNLNIKGITKNPFNDIVINQIYEYKNVVICYAYDKRKRINKLSKYKDGKFTDLKLNFDVVSTYEFGNSRVFYGYDNSDKKYKLYRFNGSVLLLAVDDCFSTMNVEYQNNIILNKYDSDRNYTIVKVDPSWNVSEISKGNTMAEYFISDNWLYISAKPQEGIGPYFMVFNGKSVLRVGIISNENIEGEIFLKDIRVCSNRVYAIARVKKAGSSSSATKGKLFLLEENSAVMLPYDPYDMDFTLIESYNGKILLSGSYGEGKDKNYENYEFENLQYKPLSSNPKFADRDISFRNSQISQKTMFLTGKIINVTTNKTEDVMYVNKDGIWNYAMDVISIKSTAATSQGIYLNIVDYDRTKPQSKRDSVLFIDPSVKITNAAIDFKITNQTIMWDSLVFSGSNNITKRAEVNRHSKEYSELIRNFSVNYWEPVGQRIFTGGTQDGIYSFYCLNKDNTLMLRSKFEVKKVLTTGLPNTYLVYGTERDKKSAYRNTNVLYLYDIQKGSFSLIAAGISIGQIMMISD